MSSLTYIVSENNTKLPDLVLDVDGCDPREGGLRLCCYVI